MSGDAYKVQATLPKGVAVEWIVPPEPPKMSWKREVLYKRDAEGGIILDENGNPEVDKAFEHAFEVTHIKFDWQAGHDQDGMDIRWNGGEKDSEEGDLNHKGNGVGDGEYIAPDDKSAANGGGIPDGAGKGFSDPVLWVAGTEESPRKPKIQVRIRLRKIDNPNPLQHSDPAAPVNKHRAIIRAENIFEAPGIQDAGFMNWKPRTVYFDKGVSKEYDETTGAFASSEYVTFELDDSVPNKVGDYIAKYKCYMKEIKYWDATLGEWVIADHQDEVEFDLTSRIDMYSVLAAPAQPWNLDEPSHPWVSAIGFAWYACKAVGKTTLATATDAIVGHLFSGHGVKYNHSDGESVYVFRAKLPNPPVGLQLVEGELYLINIQGYMRIDAPLKTFAGGNPNLPQVDVPAVGCFDQAGAVTALVNLVHGGGAAFQRHQRFGYLKAIDHVGGQKANNPFFWHPTNNPEKLLGTDPGYETDLHYHSNPVNGKIARSLFASHAYVIVDGKAVDATVGPVKVGDGKDVDDYLDLVRDTSTAAEQKVPHAGFPDVEAVARPILNTGTTYSTKFEPREE